MSRFELGGKGDPIPLIALPDPNLDENLPPQQFILSNGVPFDKTDWVGLGYTHYEVWCVGAAGGRGAAYSGNVMWRHTAVRPVMNSAEWANYLDLMVYYSAQLTPPHGPYGGTEAGVRAYYESQFPAHDPWYVLTYLGGVLQDNAVRGGGGGGGGVEVASGVLADLDTLTPVVVGASGADAATGQAQVNGLWTPPAYEVWSGGTALMQWATEWMNEYPLPHSSFAVGLPGGDGGASSFGGDICRASGGKGGKPFMVWNGSAFVEDGDGGAGGIGGQTTAGGGAAGASSPGVNGSDGSWDGSIGAGGGGGHAAHVNPGSGSPGFPGYVPATTTPASDGGRGAFSYADTSVFGDRQQEQLGYFHEVQFDYYTGVQTVDQIVNQTSYTTPGGGGGARAFRTINKGSRAPTFDPAGAVVVRLTAVL